jgi:hypothetical protein
MESNASSVASGEDVLEAVLVAAVSEVVRLAAECSMTRCAFLGELVRHAEEGLIL